MGTDDMEYVFLRCRRCGEMEKVMKNAGGGNWVSRFNEARMAEFLLLHSDHGLEVSDARVDDVPFEGVMSPEVPGLLTVLPREED